MDARQEPALRYITGGSTARPLVSAGPVSGTMQPPLHSGSVQRRPSRQSGYYSSRSIWFSLTLSSRMVASFWTA